MTIVQLYREDVWEEEVLQWIRLSPETLGIVADFKYETVFLINQRIFIQDGKN